MKRYQIENIVPTIFTLVSIYLLIIKFEFSLLFLGGLIFSLLGLIIWWLGKIALGDMFTALPKAKKVVQTGIYSKIRHPIYFGLSLTLIGWIFLIRTEVSIILSIIVILSLIARAYYEEKILIKKFGKEYLKYKKETWF